MNATFAPGDTFRGGFTLRRVDTMNAANADSPPTITLYRNGTADGAVTLTPAAVSGKGGAYQVTGTIPSTYAFGDLIEVLAEATVNLVTDRHWIYRDRLAVPGQIRSGTAQGGASASITLDAAASATANLYVGLRVRIIGGTGLGQVRTITAYDGTTKVATVDRAWTIAPDATSGFALEPSTAPALNSSLQVGVGSLAANSVTATALATDAADEIATNVWSFTGVRALNDFGTLVSDIATTVWNFGTRTLTAIADSAGVGTLLTRLSSTRAALLDNLDAAVSAALASAASAASAASTAATQATNAASSAASADTKATTILGRIGGFLGTGADTIQGFFLALLRKDAPLPGSIGGTFTPAADSLEALRERGDIAWVTGASGGNTFLVIEMPGRIIDTTNRSIVEGASAPARTVQIVEKSGKPVDLTNAISVTYQLKARVGTKVVSGTATVLYAPLGIVSYAWQTNDTNTPGIYRETWTVAFAGGGNRSFPVELDTDFTITRAA